MKYLSTTLVGLSLTLTCVSAMATELAPGALLPASAPAGQVTPRADNTGINERDANSTTRTNGTYFSSQS